MKLKYLVVICGVLLLTIFAIDNSYAIDDKEINNIEDLKLDITLEYDENEVILNNNIYNFIDLVDDYLIPTATFNMSDKLNENYDFITIFAINFILNNEEYYKNSIILGEEYIYDDGYNTYKTNKYVDVNVLYDITYNILGKKNYYIINDYLNTENNLVPLLLIDSYDFSMNLKELVSIEKNNSKYIVSVKYDNMDLIYKYTFEIMDNMLIISNLEVY